MLPAFRLSRPAPAPLAGQVQGDADMPFITTTDGAHIFYKDWGSKTPSRSFSITAGRSAPTIGTPQMMFFLHEGYRVVAHDRRGHGRSSQTDGGNEMDTYAADVKQLAAS